jgi:hypothetical protein
MTTEDMIKADARLSALETIVCQVFAVLYRTMPRETFDAAKRQALEGARKLSFPGLDAAYSDVMSAEFEAALERLYSTIQVHLDALEKHRPK